MELFTRFLTFVIIGLMCACTDSRASEEQPGIDPGQPAVPQADTADSPAAAGEDSSPTAETSAPVKPAESRHLYKVKWSVKLNERSSSGVRVINPDCIVTSRRTYGMEVFNALGEVVLAYSDERVPGLEEEGLTFRPDGSYYRVTKHTENYKPDKPYIELAYHAADGTQVWSKMLTNGWIQEGRIMVKPDGFVTIASASEKLGRNDRRMFLRITKFGLDGEVISTHEKDQEQNNQHSFGYSLRPMDDGTYRSGQSSWITAYDRELNEMWKYQARGCRREFEVQDDGTAYALIKAPEQLIKVGADGKLAWSCNLSENAIGRLNSYNESGHAFGSYLTVALDGTVYVCDAYSSLSAVSADGEHLWSVQDPRRARGEGDDWLYSFDYPEAPVVSPDGTIYLKSDDDNLMAVSPAGQVLFVDKRFAELRDPPAISPDGTVYVSSGGWLYALDPTQPAVAESLAEQDEIVAAEAARMAEREIEWAAQREEMEAQVAAIVEAEGGDPDKILAGLYGFGEPDIQPDPDGPYIADRTEIAAIVIEAMHGYYARHGEYPPFLRGIKYADDPLIKDGFLAAYPLMWPQPGCHCGEYGNWEGHIYSRWGCATRLPEDHAGDALPDETHRHTDACGHHGSITASNRFGYTRGDYLARDAQEAWLWFYGSNIWPEQNNPIPDDLSEMQAEEYYDLFTGFGAYGPVGLDLLGPNGKLSPDGIPDGICLLYKLKAGELTEVIRAEGI